MRFVGARQDLPVPRKWQPKFFSKCLEFWAFCAVATSWGNRLLMGSKHCLSGGNFTLYFTFLVDLPMPKKLPPPLGGPPPSEISLPRAPLVRVIAQVRFPGILKIDNKDAVSGFQEAIRRDYPLFEQVAKQQIQVQYGPGGPDVKQLPGNVWRFQDFSKKLARFA